MKKSGKRRVLTKSSEKLKARNSNSSKQTFFVAGIGASAGGLEALKLFFDNTPPISGVAYIIVQHLDPTHKSLLSELIGAHTKMKVNEVKDGERVEPNHVYIIPPNKDLTIKNGILLLRKPSQQRSVRRPIDNFFHSLAADQREKAIGVVLSGTGTEGAIGLTVIREEGGVAFVQDPKTAIFSGMPDAAIAAKTADYILSPDKIPLQIKKYIDNLKKHNTNDLKLTSPLDSQLRRIYSLIRNQTGYDFTNYKTNTIIRRISKRIALNQLNDIESYISFLEQNPIEVEKLYKDFFIGVTSFFRDKEVYAFMEKSSIPHLLKLCSDKQELRAWVCACSTGEEAYSLAILFKEAIEKSRKYIKVTIFASDIDKDAIDIARNGFYSESAVAGIDPSRLSKYFIKQESGYQMKKEIREMVVFAHHNVIKDPPFSRLDMISCRNLLIYMNSDLQKKIIQIFNYSLNKDGVLLLGTSESVGEFSNYFEAFDPKVKIYRKKKEATARKPNTDFELSSLRNIITLQKKVEIKGTEKKRRIPDLTQKILLDSYAPPSVIINKDNTVLYFSGKTGFYLEPPVGEASMNILDMAKKGLKPQLEAAIKRARLIRSEVNVKNVDVKVNSTFQKVNLVVKPVISKEYEKGSLLIIFETANKVKGVNNKTEKDMGKKFPRISELEKELKITREHLQTAIDELELSNENLQTTNEEYQSSNEELQSTNEELETSREELQSVNEELITVNAELSTKIDQLSQANDDLNNLLSSIEVATIFLDRDLKIKRFTPTATKIFNLIPTDIDRPVMHLSSNIVYKALVDDVKSVLKSLAVKSADVQAIDGTYYHMRILPYRTSENVIEGVLVTFVDITEQKKVEERLKKTNEHLNLVMENLPAVPFTCITEPEIIFSFVGKSSEKVTGFLPEQFTKKSSFFINRIHPLDKKKMISSFANLSKKGSVDLPFRWKCLDGKYKNFINYLRFVKAENGRSSYVVGVWQEVTNNK